jgi:uncharacterized protein YkwD
MAGWFKSEGHCQNLMNPGFKDVGVAETTITGFRISAGVFPSLPNSKN